MASGANAEVGVGTGGMATKLAAAQIARSADRFTCIHRVRPPERGDSMAAVCDVCAKGPGFGHNVPWSKKKTNRRWNPNIQRVRAVVEGTHKRLYVCTSCIKAGKVSR